MSAAGLVLFIVGGFCGQLAAVVVVELLRPWVSHRVEHRQIRQRVSVSGGAMMCGHCGEWLRGRAS